MAEEPVNEAPLDEPRDQRGPECRRCGYDLRGHEEDGSCPECGLPVAASIGGGYLAHADPLWVSRLQLGAATGVLAAAVTLLAWTPHLFPGLSSRLPRWAHVTMWANSAGALLTLIAGWLIATPEADERPATFAFVRRGLRWAVAASLALHIPGLDQWPYAWENGRIFLFTVPFSMALDIAVSVLFYIYLRRLGELLPDPFLLRHSLFVMAAMIAVTGLNRVAPAVLEWFGSTAGGYRPPAVPPLAQALVTCAALVYTLLLERQAYVSFGTAAAEARGNWGAPAAEAN
jgi:hypothetical protein